MCARSSQGLESITCSSIEPSIPDFVLKVRHPFSASLVFKLQNSLWDAINGLKTKPLFASLVYNENKSQFCLSP